MINISSLFLYMTIFGGGGLGAVIRYVLSSLIGRHAGTTFPWGTLVVNLIGAFCIGLVTSLAAYKFNMSEMMRAFLVTGVLGGFTTFSAFSLETSLLLTRGENGAAIGYIMASVIGTVLLVMAAHAMVRLLSA